MSDELSLTDEDNEATDQLSAMSTSNLHIVAINDDDANSSKLNDGTILESRATSQDHSI